MTHPTRTQSTSSLSALFTSEVPLYPTSTLPSPLFYNSGDSEEEEEGDDELIYPHEYGDSDDSEYDTEDGDVAVLYGSTIDLELIYPAGINPLGGEDPSCLNFTNFDDVPGDDNNDEEDVENHKIETATVGRVFRANSVTLVDVDEQQVNV
ncbi:hypothetical protein TWF192_000195 [Orbilia oligospora]|uniref:Uncharacterized protein n=1 Tax=Orbilia oligospora TaxID=2813651 RepID=A0A6G1MNR9_ORBOL|nr:hypothetical protein TWF679_008929 [Orbilia oligospora]KAF3231247.1 hypothetical protein TWF191_006738 [Orbilia oligospora]KAF3265545.1 hypothetical protein TWF192_000195 [Orbilia oligospora]